MTIFREIWGGVGAKVRIVALVRRAAVAHRRFRKNGRLGNLTVPAGAGGELPLRRALAQNSPSASASRPTIVWATMRCAAPSRLPLHSAWRASRGSFPPHSHAAQRVRARGAADPARPRAHPVLQRLCHGDLRPLLAQARDEEGFPAAPRTVSLAHCLAPRIRPTPPPTSRPTRAAATRQRCFIFEAGSPPRPTK